MSNKNGKSPFFKVSLKPMVMRNFDNLTDINKYVSVKILFWTLIWIILAPCLNIRGVICSLSRSARATNTESNLDALWTRPTAVLNLDGKHV